MQFELLPFLQFHLRRFWATQTFLCVCLAFAIVAMLGTVSVWIGLGNVERDALSKLADLKSRQVQVAHQPALLTEAPESLRSFNSPETVAAFHQSAASTATSIAELTFTLDEGPTQPFLRYRASLTLSANYLAIRRFVDQVLAALPDVSLDTMSCGRKGIGDPVLQCDLVFTIFFKKEDHG